MATTNPKLTQSVTPELRSISIERIQSLLSKIIRTNLGSQYACKTASLAEFRDAISTHGSDSDTTLVEDFRRCVPLSDYSSYKPFMAAFDQRPCREADVENLFAPGLPSFLVASSATSGKEPKLFPKYRTFIRNMFDARAKMAMINYFGYKEVREVERESGQIVKKIPVCNGSSSSMRTTMGWVNVDDDDSRMSSIIPGFIAPWAASMIRHHKSFLMIHALFTLACRDVDRIATTFSTQFYDLIRHIDEEWDMLVSSIKDGTVPDLPGVSGVRSHLQVHLHANPDRAAEIRDIGPPFSRQGWAACIWPKLSVIVCVCSGPFATTIPKIKEIIGPTITIRSLGYLASETYIASPHRPDDPDSFVLQYHDLVEFLDITAEESHKNLSQAWELEVGKRYEVVLTTIDGLWRYRLDDIIDVLGFDVDSGSPVFAFFGRRGPRIHLPGMLVSETHIMLAIQAVSLDVIQIHEFTTMLDDRKSTRTVGFFVELAGTLGPNAHLAPSRLAEGLAAANTGFQGLLRIAKVGCPTVRIVRPGTFSEYRRWKAEMAVGPGQVKIPVILLDETSMKWMVERVVGEL